MKMLEYRVNFYKYILKIILLSILYGDWILKGFLMLFDILLSSIRKWLVKWYVCVFNWCLKVFIEKDEDVYYYILS